VDKKRLLLFGDAESPHLLKWAVELSVYYDLFIVSGRTIKQDFFTFIPTHQCVSLSYSINATGGNYSILFSLPKLINIIKLWNPHYINAHYITSYGFTAAIAKTLTNNNSKLILTAWGTDILITPYKNWIYKALTKFALKKCDLLITDADVVSKRANQLFLTATETIAFGLPSLPTINKDLKQPFLFFSNRALSENYRIDKVIKIFYEIQHVYQEAQLIIANNGSELTNLQNLCSVLKIKSKVQFVGYLTTDEQREYYEKSNFYFTLPESDATSVSLLEAMAYGCIPIVSNLEANKEWIIDGRNGIIEKENLLKDIEKAIENHDRITLLNQEIIMKKGIFPENIKRLIKRIESL
jgi:glycosyltransferase involved in cell wall biosynthesis